MFLLKLPQAGEQENIVNPLPRSLPQGEGRWKSPSHEGREDGKVPPTRGGKMEKPLPQGEGRRKRRFEIKRTLNLEQFF